MLFPKSRFVLASALALGLLTTTPAQAAEVPAQFNVTGSGFGHGVGMSQYGAYGMALEGNSADQILTHYYQGTTVSSYNFAPVNSGNVRVNVQGDDSYMYLRFEANPQNPVSGTAPTITIGGTAVTGVAINTDYTFTLSGTNFVLSGSGIADTTGSTASITWDNATTLANVNYGVPGSSAVGMLGVVGSCSTSTCPHRYKYGSFEIFVSALRAGIEVSQDLQAVNIINVNRDYLYGLGEMPSSWNVNALSAQAIAGRTYALKKMLAYPASDRDDCGCQLFSDTSDQNFVGFAKEYLTSGTNWKTAVDNTITSATDGKVITYGGQPIAGHYSSSSGGTTTPASEWTTTAYPYEVSVDDHWAHLPAVNNSKTAWNVTVDQNTLVSRLKGYGVAVTDVASIAITAKYASGAVSQLTITDSQGVPLVVEVGPGKTITPDRLRTTFGAYSTYWSAVGVGAGVQPGTAVPPAAVTAVRSLPTLKWPSSTILPGDTSVTGKVSPVQAGVKVELQILRGKTWSTVATDYTGKAGIWKTSWRGVTAGTYKMRVLATTPKNSIKSSTRTLKAIGSVAIRAPKSTTRNTTVGISGSVRPAVEGVPVTVQMKVGSAGWKTVATVNTDGAGNWGYSAATGSKKTTIQFRVKTTDGRVGSLTSKTLRTTVK